MELVLGVIITVVQAVMFVEAVELENQKIPMLLLLAGIFYALAAAFYVGIGISSGHEDLERQAASNAAWTGGAWLASDMLAFLFWMRSKRTSHSGTRPR
jgi:hypothetical protein